MISSGKSVKAPDSVNIFACGFSDGKVEVFHVDVIKVTAEAGSKMPTKDIGSMQIKGSAMKGSSAHKDMS